VGERADHLKRARDNRAFAARLVSTDNPDPTDVQWAVTAAFYSALHLVEATFALHGIHCEHHRDRPMIMNQVGISIDVQKAYRSLQGFSEEARYGLTDFSVSFFKMTVIIRYLEQIERALLRPES